MAITKILPVRGQLKGCLDYAANPQKTEYFSTADMQRLIGYTQNKDKTEHQLYVSGFNCMPQNAYCIMQATKQRWGKPLNGGNVGYHIIQSFKPGEATPDQVHEIGCEFARRFLADRFECTVSTHLDKGHLHNHIVVNSVSFMDGRMFRNDFTTYYKGIRAVSDELCRENRLSVVETDGHGKSYGEWKHEKEGSPTLRGMVKADVEVAMTTADSFAGFVAELQKMGYAVKYGPKAAHMTVRHKEAQKNIRLDKISPTSAKIRCGGTSGNCKHFRLKCSRNISSKQHLSHHVGSRKSSLSLFAAAHGIAADGTAVTAKLPGLWLAIIATVHC